GIRALVAADVPVQRMPVAPRPVVKLRPEAFAAPRMTAAAPVGLQPTAPAAHRAAGVGQRALMADTDPQDIRGGQPLLSATPSAAMPAVRRTFSATRPNGASASAVEGTHPSSDGYDIVKTAPVLQRAEDQEPAATTDTEARQQPETEPDWD